MPVLSFAIVTTMLQAHSRWDVLRMTQHVSISIEAPVSDGLVFNQGKHART